MRWLQRRLRLPKIAGVLIVHLAVLAVVGIVVWYLVVAVGDRVVEAAADAPGLVTAEVRKLIPVVGPAASIALFGLAGMIEGGVAWTFASFLAIAVFLRISVDNVVGPVVLGRAVTLHPVVVIVAFLIGASLFGFFGVFVAMPAAAAIKIVLSVWYAEGDGEPRRPA